MLIESMLFIFQGANSVKWKKKGVETNRRRQTRRSKGEDFDTIHKI